MRAGAALVALLALAACTANPPRPAGQVGMSLLDVPGEQRMQLGRNERFALPLPDQANALPTYPEKLLAEHLSRQVVCVGLNVDEHGQAVAAEPIHDIDDCPPADRLRDELFDAVRRTLLGWHFEPAFRCVYPAGVTPSELGCMTPPAEEVAVAVRMPYRFEFEQRDGIGSVLQTTP